MSETPPILSTWTGEHFVPANKHMVERCAKFFEPGGTYRIEFKDDRSAASHKSFFATVNAAWKNLPEDIASDFPSPDHLRKWALCKAGYADERNIVCDTEEDAKRTAALARSLDGFAVIVRRGNVVKVYTAKSQSQRAMKKAEFQASNQAVRNIIAELLKVEPNTLDANRDHDAPHQPNPIPADHISQPEAPAPEQREPPMRQSPNPPQAGPSSLTGPAEEPPPPPQPGASTAQASPELAFPASGATSDAKGPEEKAGSGGELMPRTYSELVAYIKIWTGYVKDGKRFAERIEKEKRMLWPTIQPPLTTGQINHLDSLLDDRAARL